MEKRGRCRCGSVLVFRPTSQGYKTRCPACHAVVRLREEGAAKPALPADATPPDLSVLQTHESSAPRAEAEIPAYYDPTPTPRPRRLGWWVIPVAVVALLLLLIVAALLFR
jgi:hypothetical protein